MVFAQRVRAMITYKQISVFYLNGNSRRGVIVPEFFDDRDIADYLFSHSIAWGRIEVDMTGLTFNNYGPHFQSYEVFSYSFRHIPHYNKDYEN